MDVGKEKMKRDRDRDTERQRGRDRQTDRQAHRQRPFLMRIFRSALKFVFRENKLFAFLLNFMIGEGLKKSMLKICFSLIKKPITNHIKLLGVLQK